MSMLSAQCDELRAMAEIVGLAMPQAATLMMEAADTIWELRESVHRERAEADKLREERDTYRDLVGCMVHPDIPDQLASENAKLRELVTELHSLATDERVYVEYENESWERRVDAAEESMRELGIEVKQWY